jgi:hypothetical protein
MSTPEQEGRPAMIGCPRCGQPIRADQDWCLHCGAAARTRLAPSPNWRAPVALLATVVVLSVAALLGAFVILTNDPGPVTGATGATGPTAVAPAVPVPVPVPVPAAPTGPTGVPAPAAPSGATGTTGPPGG